MYLINVMFYPLYYLLDKKQERLLLYNTNGRDKSDELAI